MGQNQSKIKEFFDKNIPPLTFHLKAEPTIAVNVATVNNAQRLLAGLSNFVHPVVYDFIEYLGEHEPEDFTNDIQELVSLKGFTRFLFYLTVYTGNLGMMLEMHCYSYLPRIGVDLDKVKSTEYFPHIRDKRIEENPYAILFDGDINKLITFCNGLESTYVRVNLVDGFMDISATDILGYIGATE